MERFTEKEKLGIRDLLEHLELPDLITLTDTVTNRAVSAESRKEAVAAILLYTTSALQLLRRKKVKREHLYQYLAEKGFIESTSSDKPYLCRRILEIWDSSKKMTSDGKEFDSNEISDVSSDKEVNVVSVSSPHCSEQVLDTDGQALAEHFVSWFYRILNSNIAESNIQHAAPSSPDNSWGHHHFWDDVKGTITMIGNEHTHDEWQGAQAVSTKLAEVVSSEKLFFNANLSSVKGSLDTYGLERIFAGGTVHRYQQCLGIFEQSFGLIRDPLTKNSWKIKSTNLKLKAQCQIQGNQTPVLSAPESGPLAIPRN